MQELLRAAAQPKNKSDCLKKSGKWTPNKHNTWNGCVTDRDQDYDTKNTAPATGNPATLFPAEQYGTCPVPLMALSYDWTALNKKIDDMQPDGNTNQAIGLQWGYQSLTAAPFTDSAEGFKLPYKEVIILLTDGLNTEDRWYNNASQIDARQKMTCDNVKAAGITLYTIQVNTDGDPTSTLLKNCASTHGQVLHADVRERNDHRLQSNRDRTVQSAGRQIKTRATRRANTKPGGGRRAYSPKRDEITSRSRSCRTGSRTAGTSRARDRNRARRAWSPPPRSLRRSTWHTRSELRRPSRTTLRRATSRMAAVPCSNTFLE